MRLDVIDGLLNRGDLFGFFIRDLDFEFFFEGHHQFNGIQRIGAQIVDERRIDLHLGFIDSELFGNDFLHTLFDVFHVLTQTFQLDV